MIALIARYWKQFLKWCGLLPRVEPCIAEPKATLEQAQDVTRLSAYMVVDLPEPLDPDKIYIVGENGNDWVIVLLCPCGCQASIHLNILKSARPRWDFSMDTKARITVTPSIWRTSGCRSHFFIRNGSVRWVQEPVSDEN